MHQSLERKIKVCHIAHRLTGKADGVFNHLKMIFDLVDKDKFEHILMYSGIDENINLTVRLMGVKVYNIPEMNKKIPLKLFFHLLKVLKNENVDIIQAHLVKPYIISGLLNLFLNKKVIYNYHGIFIENDYYNSVEKLILRVIHSFISFLRLVNVVIVPSYGSKRKLELETRQFKKILVYYNGFRISSNSKSDENEKFIDFLRELKQKYFLVGIICRIDAKKRIDIALRVLQKLKKQQNDIFFLFVGDGELIQNMREFSKSLQVDDRACFFGYLPEVRYYIQFFDLVLFTSEFEGFPLTIWESMFNRVPIVSSDVGGIKEILEGENCGVVYPFGDVETCVKIISDLYHNREKLKQMGENGRRAIIEKYNEKQFKEFFEKLYTDLVYEK
ncbi:MAG: glycosyltransferase [Ignavibacteria bacterium]